ncbi:MAG: heavy metal-binding domain-containing protein [Thiotrichaceae bacterium]
MNGGAYQLVYVIGLLILAYWIGSYRERQHYKSIIKRENTLNSLPAVNLKTAPKGSFEHALVMGNVTISVDYFKRFLATLHAFFGGRITSYETLLDRSRREALLRMKEMAKEKQAVLILNVKYETVSIFKGSGKSIGSVEVLAYGTALIPHPSS